MRQLSRMRSARISRSSGVDGNASEMASSDFNRFNGFNAIEDELSNMESVPRGMSTPKRKALRSPFLMRKRTSLGQSLRENSFE